MKNIPIGLRTRNRPVYLDVTLRSLLGTDLPNDARIVVLDDSSDDPLARRYLFSDETMVLPEPFTWPESDAWKRHVGAMPVVSSITGIRSKVPVIQPQSRRGVRGGVFWCIDEMMKRHTSDEAVILIEADVVFHRDWYKATLHGWEACKDKEGPNGNQLGLLTAYDRRPKGLPKADATEMGWAWRGVRKHANGRWGCGGGIGGVMYLVTRPFYLAAIEKFRRRYPTSQRSGDTALQGLAGHHRFSIAATSPSFIQHIGADSSAWPMKGWRHARNFRKPFVLKEQIER